MKHVSIPITKIDEPWCKVILANGAVLIYRLIVKSAFQVMTDDGQPYVENGKQTFGLDTQIVIGVEQEPVEKRDMN